MKTITFIYPDESYTQYDFENRYGEKGEVAVHAYDGKGILSDGFITKKQAQREIKKLTKAWQK